LAFVFLLRLPRHTPPTLFPYTTLFRSDAAADRQIGLHDIDRGKRRQIAEIVPGEFAFTRGDRNIGGGADLRLAALVVGGDRLLRSEEHTSELQSRFDLVCRLLLEKKKL